MKKLYELSQLNKKRIVGLMSGTSVDAVDAALVEVAGSGIGTQIELISFIEYPIPSDLRSRIFELFSGGDVAKVCKLNFEVGELFAEAALEVIAKANLKPSEVQLIGSHGQTVYHMPPNPSKPKGSTLQIGEAAVIAHTTGIITVDNFRVADVALGGHGAPLVPYVDFLLFSHPTKNRAMQNIGGIGNVTLLRANSSLEELIAFDTGPGNMITDELARHITKGAQNCDLDGKLAAKGKVNEVLLQKLMKHPFVRATPPKSTGREEFGKEFAQKLIQEAQRSGINELDLIATATAFTAKSIFENYKAFIRPKCNIDEIIVSGGGVHNPTLMRFLEGYLQPIPVKNLDEYGICSDAKEAVAFAILANEAISGNFSNVPTVTGAKRRAVLGKISQV